MKIAKTVLLPVAFLVVTAFIMGEAMAARSLSKELAPDVTPEILAKVLRDAKVYIAGKGSKDVVLLADPFCENSRKTYRELQTHRERIRTVRILWVSVFPNKGSDVAAAFAMRMQASGKGESALKAVFDLDIPPSAPEVDKAREKALVLSNEKFRITLGEMGLQRLKPELDQVQRNTRLANEIGYTGTPHFIVDGRVLHGHSGPAIRILLQ